MIPSFSMLSCACGGAALQEKLLKEAEERRAGITPPTEPALLIDFLLDCDSQDTEHFVIQCRDNLSTEFFAALDTRIGQERFLPEPDEDTLAELEGLRLYVQQTLQAQDSVMKGVQPSSQCMSLQIRSVRGQNCHASLPSAATSSASS